FSDRGQWIVSLGHNFISVNDDYARAFIPATGTGGGDQNDSDRFGTQEQPLNPGLYALSSLPISGSPLIDQGDTARASTSALTTDIYGAARNVGAGVD